MYADVVIVGGGMTGLGTAHHLEVEACLFEKEPRSRWLPPVRLQAGLHHRPHGAPAAFSRSVRAPPDVRAAPPSTGCTLDATPKSTSWIAGYPTPFNTTYMLSRTRPAFSA